MFIRDRRLREGQAVATGTESAGAEPRSAEGSPCEHLSRQEQRLREGPAVAAGGGGHPHAGWLIIPWKMMFVLLDLFIINVISIIKFSKK